MTSISLFVLIFILLNCRIMLSAAYGDAWFLPLRGALALRFREYYARAIMCGVSSERSHSELCSDSAPLLKGKQHAAHRINLYRPQPLITKQNCVLNTTLHRYKKVGGVNGPVWEHLCRCHVTLAQLFFVIGRLTCNTPIKARG